MDNLEGLFKFYESKLKNVNLSTLTTYPALYSGDDWKKYEKYSDIGYQRKLAYRGDNVEILILSWKKGQKSKIHNHPDNGCILTLLKGKIKETRYEIKDISVVNETIINTYEPSYIDNSECYHDIEALEDSVSLHIYSPPNYRPTYF